MRIDSKDIKSFPRHIQDQINAKLKIAKKKKGVKLPKADSTLEAEFERLLKINGVPLGEKQYKFCDKRRFRLDRAWPDKMICVDLDGERYHAHPKQMNQDIEKRNLAKSLGWYVLIFSGEMIAKDPDGCIAQLKKVLGI